MKRLLSTLSEKWPEYLLEILVLIIGIYGAFALEEWNEVRKDSTSKHLIVDNLQREFELNLSQLDTVLSYDRQAAEACVRLLGMIKSEQLPDDDYMDSLVNKSANLWSFDPSDGALKSVITSGQIHLLNQETLKEYLSGWESMVQDAHEDEQRFINHHLGTFPKFYDRHMLGNSSHFYDNRVPKSHFKSDYRALLDDPSFENYLTDKLWMVLDTEHDLNKLKSRLKEILDLLKQEK